MAIRKKPTNLSAEESSRKSRRHQQSLKIPPRKMSFRSNNTDRAREQQSRGFIATIFRKKSADSKHQGLAQMNHNHAYVDGSQQDLSPTGRWGIKAAAASMAAGQHSPTTGAYSAPALMREVSLLQEQVAHQAEQLEELHRELEERDAEGDKLRQALNLERFRYELLVDLWSMRVLDNEELGLQVEQHNGHNELR
ncbi:hypothetical protein Ndes2526B_g03629 [Nannochloris sp. 'desiccata']